MSDVQWSPPKKESLDARISVCGPAAGVSVRLARFYVRRLQLAVSAMILLTVVGGAWWLLHWASINFSRTVRAARETAPLAASISSLSQRIRSVARDSAVLPRLVQWQRDADMARRQFDTSKLKSIGEQMTQLLKRLNDANENRATRDPDQVTRDPD